MFKQQLPKILCILLSSVFVMQSVNGHAINNNLSSSFIEDNISWSCANNATCVSQVSNEILNSLKMRKPIRISGIVIEPLKQSAETGRSANFMDWMNGNSLKIPFGSMTLSVQRSDKYNNYMEVALLSKYTSEGRGDGGLGGGIGGGGIGGGGIGGGGGGHGGGGGGIGGGNHKEKKQLQMYIPMFLAMNAVGWMLLALKTVALLVFKALFVSKIAFVVAASVVIKKLMDSATEKMMQSHHFDHPEPIMMPYNMEYAMPSQHYHHTTDMGGNDLYSLHMAAAAAGHDNGSPHSLESIAAESQLNHVVNLQNGTQLGQNIVGIQTVPKVKRQDRETWAGFRRKPVLYNYLTARSPPTMYRK